MKPLIKELFFQFVRIELPRNRASILMYHSVSDRPDYFWAVPRSDFASQMKYLSDAKKPVIALAELVRRVRSGESLGGSVALSFDDGYRDNYTNAFPVLKKYGFPATIFVTTDCMGKFDTHNLEHLSVGEMKEMEASGLIDIEPHTKSHPRLARLSNDAAREEIEGSRKRVADILGKPAPLFAYPYGDFNAETERIVKNSGFIAAATVREGTVSSESDPFQLPRNSIDRSTTLRQFRGKISRAVDFYQALKLWE
ncbi:MAG: polysaccharide deacetylase family protein [bacterium]|nr:polysaccharide deacetylase family protein [bacterium]